MRRVVLILFILVFCVIYAHAEESRLLVQDLDLKVYISLDHEIYRIDKDIYLFIEVMNRSSGPVQFITSPYKLNNVKMEIKNLQTGELVEEKYSKIMKDNDMKNLRPELFNFNKTTLYPDEILKFKINLPEYYIFSQPGQYKITVHYDPFPDNAAPHTILPSNSLYLILKESQLDEDYKDLMNYLKKKEEEKSYTPEEALKFILDTYMQENWKNHFLYINLDSIIKRYDEFKDRYKNASMPLKKEIIEDFKEWWKKRQDMKIDYYKILKVNKIYEEDNNTCQIECKVKYKMPAIYRTYYYIYTLKQKGIKWFLEDIQVKSYSKEK